MDIKSEVELGKDKVKVGTELVYSDNDNFQMWTVEEVDGVGFNAVSDEGDVEYFYFHELQKGWDFQ